MCLGTLETLAVSSWGALKLIAASSNNVFTAERSKFPLAPSSLNAGLMACGDITTLVGESFDYADGL